MNPNNSCFLMMLCYKSSWIDSHTPLWLRCVIYTCFQLLQMNFVTQSKDKINCFSAKSTHWENVGAVQVKMLLITLYTKEHTKSMKPHCILGSCSAQFLSIMGWGRERERVSDEITILWWRQGLRGERHSQLVVGPKHFSPSLLVPRILQPPSEPPGEERIT